MMDYNDSGQESNDDERRAEWERFTMTVCGGDGGGYVNVRNDSHDNPNEHIYSVHVANGQADSCSCEHATYRDAHCKHQIAVEQRPLVVASADAASAAMTSKQVATDGGIVEKSAGGDETAENGSESGSGGEPEITYHREPEHVGGERFARCEECGAEVVEDSYGEFDLVHERDCSRAKSVVDPYPDEEEVDRTPL